MKDLGGQGVRVAGGVAVSHCRDCDRAVMPMIERCPYCGASFPTDEFLGQTIRGNLRMETILGVGGMGIVYKAIETHLNRPVAVKMLYNTGMLDARHAEYFMREARVLAELRHPNLVSVLDFGCLEDGTFYLVLEYIPGKPLDVVIQHQGVLAPGRAARVVVQILNALEQAHAIGVIHRDLKPGNVILEPVAGQEDFVKVLDFGLAKVLPTSERSALQGGPVTEVGVVVGTPQYMSPEQVQGGAVDGRSDIYAAGTILFEMITGTLPFRSMDYITIMSRKLSEEAPRPSSRLDGLEALDAICARALARDPEARYVSVAQMRVDLLAQLPAIDAIAPPSPPATRPRGAAAEAAHGIGHTTVVALRFTRSHDPADAAPIPEQVLAFLEGFTLDLGGAFIASKGPVALGVFEDPELGSSLVPAATAAIRLTEQSLRRYPLARMGVGIARGFLSQEALLRSSWGGWEPVVSEAIALSERAKHGQILVDPLSGQAVAAALPTREAGGALSLMTANTAPTSRVAAAVAMPSRVSVELPALGLLGVRLDGAFVSLVDSRLGSALMFWGPEKLGHRHALEMVRAKARRLHIPVLECAAHASLIDRPFRPLFDLVDQILSATSESPWQEWHKPAALCRMLEGFDLDPIEREALAEQYFAGTPEDPWMALCGPDGASFEDLARGLYVLPPVHRQRLLTSALRALLGFVTAAGSVVILIEDLDRADPCTRACLSGVVQLAGETALMVVATSRQEDAVGSFEPLELKPLEGAGLDSFWAALGEGEPLSEEVRSASAGSPLYLRLWRGSPTRTVPVGMGALIKHQIDRLPRPVFLLLTVASAIGEYFEEEVLIGLFPQSRSLLAALTGAAAGGWVERCPHDPGIWRFSHRALHKAVYGRLPFEERRRYHRQIFEGLPALPSTPRRQLLAARNAMLGGLEAETARWAARLGDRVAIAGDPSASARWYGVAIKAADASASMDDLPLKAALVASMGPSSDQALELLADRRLEGVAGLRAALIAARLHRHRGRAAEAQACALAALPQASAQPAFKAALLLEISKGAALIDDLQGARRALDRARVLCSGALSLPDDLQNLICRVKVAHGELCARNGDTAAAEGAFKEAVSAAWAMQDEVGLMRAFARAAAALLRLGPSAFVLSLGRSIFKRVEQGLRLPHKIELWTIFGWAQWAQGDHDGARGSFDFAARLARVSGWGEAAAVLHDRARGRGLEVVPRADRWLEPSRDPTD